MMLGAPEMGVLMMIGMTLFGGTGLPLGIPPAAEDPLMFKVAPDECLFYVTWAGMDDPDPESSNQTEQLLAEPEVQQLFAEIERLIRNGMRPPGAAGPEVQAAVEDAIGGVKTLLTHPAAIFVSDVKIAPGGPPEISAGALVRIGTAADADKMKDKLVQYQQMLGDAVKEVEILGDTCYRIQPPDPEAPSITWGVRRSYLIVGVGDGTFEEIMKRAATEMPEWLSKTRQQLSVPRLSTLTHINLAKILETAAPLAGPEAQSIIKSLGLDNVTALSSVTGLDEEGFVSRTLLVIDGEPSGIFTLVPDQPLTADDLGPIPADATVALAARIDVSDILSAALSIIEKFEPDAREEFDEGLAPMQQALGFDLRDDVLKPLGDTWRVYNSPGEGGLVITGLTGVVNLRDADRFAAAHAKILATAQRMWESEYDPKIRQHEFAGQTIYVFDAGEDEFPLAPSWCLTDDELIVAALPQNIKAYLSRGADHRSLAEVPQVAGLFEEDAQPVALTYVDTKALFQLVYPIVPMIVQIASAELRRDDIDLDVSLIPSTLSIGRHLRPSVGALRRTPAGIELISRQTLPGIGLIGALPAAALGVTRPADMPMPVSSTSQSANNMKQIVIALHNYHTVHGKFPPAYATDDDGNPTVSWRVLILPYLEQQPLYDQFKIDEPWDSENNKRWSDISLNMYRTPQFGSRPAESNLTNYLGVFGDDAVFTGKEGTSIASIRDGTSRTIMVVEVPDEKAVPWAKPVDYKYDPEKPGAGMFGPGKDQSVAGFADGHVTRIDESIDRRVLGALFTRAGEEGGFAEDF